MCLSVRLCALLYECPLSLTHVNTHAHTDSAQAAMALRLESLERKLNAFSSAVACAQHSSGGGKGKSGVSDGGGGGAGGSSGEKKEREKRRSLHSSQYDSHTSRATRGEAWRSPTSSPAISEREKDRDRGRDRDRDMDRVSSPAISIESLTSVGDMERRDGREREIMSTHTDIQRESTRTHTHTQSERIGTHTDMQHESTGTHTDILYRLEMQKLEMKRLEVVRGGGGVWEGEAGRAGEGAGHERHRTHTETHRERDIQTHTDWKQESPWSAAKAGEEQTRRRGGGGVLMDSLFESPIQPPGLLSRCRLINIGTMP
jgi:hypothetical protein